MDADGRRSAGTAALVAIAWASTVIAADGFLSLLLDTEVVPLRDAGPLVGPIALLVAVAALLALLLARTRTVTGWLALECAVVAYLSLVLAGAAAYGVVRGSAAGALVYAGGTATSVFTMVATVLAAVAGLVQLLVVRARASGAGRPRWPWEDRFDP